MDAFPRVTRRAAARPGAAALGAAVVVGGLARWLRPSRPAASPPAWAAAPGLANARLAAGGAARIEPSVAASPAWPRRIGAASGADALAPVIAAGPAGSVCVIYLTPSRGGLPLAAASSADRAATFGPPARLLRVGQLAPSLGRVSAKSDPAAAAAAGSGYLYAALTRYGRAAARSEILVACSPDAGRSWDPSVAAGPPPVRGTPARDRRTRERLMARDWVTGDSQSPSSGQR